MGATISSGTGSAETDIAWGSEPHPWRRYGARFIDVELLGGLALFLVALASMLLGLDGIVDWMAVSSLPKSILIGSVCWILAAPLSAVLVSWTGSSPGKFLFGLRVRTHDGRRLTLMEAIRREGLVLFWGVAFAIPVASLFTLLRSLSVVEDEGRSRWDERSGTIVEARRAKGWQALGIITGTVMVCAIFLAQLYERVAGLN